MLRHVPFELIGGKHLRLLAESLVTCPEFWRPDADEILGSLQREEAHLFEFADGAIMVLSVQLNEPLDQRRLMIDCWSGDGSIFQRHDLAADLRRIAADWECDTIETLVFDLRLAHAICRIGGHVESVCVTLPVEGIG